MNLIGTFRCITKSAAGMLSLEPLEDGDRGAIVNTASVAAEDGQIGQVVSPIDRAIFCGLGQGQGGGRLAVGHVRLGQGV